MAACKGKVAVGLSTAERLNAEIDHRIKKINEYDHAIQLMEDEIAALERARSVVVGPV